MTLDLPFIWAGVIALAVLLYVVLDGFDLGCGILFPFARDRAERDVIIDTIAPVWDGNETWLVMGGGGLLAAFPKAYAVLIPAFYMPIMVMLLALVFRGVAFEFRARGGARGRPFWTAAFAGGSAMAALAQGLVLGGFIQGVAIRDGVFAGGAFDWLTPYSLLVAVGLTCGYALLGATWLVWRTETELHGAARRWAWIAGGAVALLLGAVSLATLVLHPPIAERWGVTGQGVDLARLGPRLPIPLLGLMGLGLAAWGLARRAHGWPFVGALLVFLSGYGGLAASFFPYVAPYALTYRQAANADNALAFMLVGAAAILPVVLGYTAYVYWLFRGKVTGDAGYH
jgi:cytochrome d ubiquinol oxidase subunit II